jgi:hypothetical protein
MRKLITALSIIVVLFSSTAFGKSREYYKETIISGIFDCDTKCKEHKLHYEIQDLSYRMIQIILLKISREVDNKYKEEIKND